MTPLTNYAHYRRLGLRKPWSLAGMNTVLFPVIRGAVIAAVVLLSYGIVNHRVEADQVASSNKMAAAVASNQSEIEQLRNLLARCLSKGDNPTTIGGEIWVCGATPTGVFARP